MVYGDEDEVDWSDGSLDDSLSLVSIEAAAGLSRPDQPMQIGHGQDQTFMSNIDDGHVTPCELPLGSGKTIFLFRSYATHTV